MKKLLLILSLFIAAHSNAQNVPAYVPSNGLVGWWPFTGNAIDSSGNGNNGTVNGATLTTDRFGNANRAYQFNANSNNITGSSLYQTGINQYSISGWFNKNVNTNSQPGSIVSGSSCASTPNRTGLRTYVGNNNTFHLTVESQNCLNGVGSGTNSFNVSDGQWHHFVAILNTSSTSLTVSPSSVSVFIDGVLVPQTQYAQQSSNLPLLPLNNQNLPIIIGNSICACDYFPGKLDEIGIWNRALTPCEIQALYTGLPSTFNTNLITQDTIKTCGDSVLVAATSGLNSYSWNTGTTTSSVFAKNTGWYKVTGGSTSGCSATDSVFVSILKANILNNDTTVCLGASLTLNAQQLVSGTSCTKSGLATNLQNGLVGYWPFCGNANDMSGNGNNGTVNGATLTTDRFGNANSAYSFNGVNNVINIANSNSLNPSQISICAWYKPNQDNLCILEKSNTNSPMENSYGITHNDGWQIPRGLKTSIGVGNCGPYSHATSNTTWGPLNQITNNIWQFIVVTIDNNGLTKQYINGILNYSSTINPLICCNSSTSNLRFGKHWDGDPEWFNGKLDDIAIWNRALSASEVTQLYQASAYATTYLWSTGATTASINVNPTQTTKYWLQVSNGISTCTDTVTITVQNPAAPAVNNVSYCQGATASVLTATASAGNSLMWYSTATGGAGSSTAPIPSTTTVGTTTYYVSQITPQGCESVRASLTVTVNALPQASITASKTPIICTGDSVVFSVSPQVAGQSYVWYKDGVIINGASSTSYAAKQSGAYSVRVTNSNGCSITTATSTLNVYPWPTVNAGPDKEVPAGTSVDIITQTSNAQSIAWSPITGLSCTNCASPTATVNFPIVYIVTVTSAGGCSVSDTVEIQLVCEEDLLYMPNTFSPNGDGENDRFYPMGKGLGEVTVFRIVNRLGQVVYTRSRFAINNASYGWDGTLNGADLGMDVYSYYIEVPCATGQIIKKTGDISLLR
jgi:gliding motility-associated-like protein